ncbi:penicillin-binding protein [Spiractinospora alimapuensis]|nr:penicillin-binding protein [Spiractinospora alimapuensis]
MPAIVLVLVLVGAGVSWFYFFRASPEDTADDFVAAWQEGDYAAMAALASDGAGLQDLYADVSDQLGLESVAVTLEDVVQDGGAATADFTATMELGDAGEWSYDGQLALLRQEGDWFVDYSPATLHPELEEGQSLTRTNDWEERGEILAADGTRLDTDDASGSVQMMVGQLAEASEEDLEDLGAGYQEGDLVGVSGIQGAQEARLAGTPSVSIRVTDEDAEDEEDEEDEDAADEEEDAEEDVTEVGRIEGEPGEDVTTSLDPAVQAAAGGAIAAQDDPTAMVVIRPSTGEVLASANVPGGFDRAFEGQYPAGSAFKIITYEALLNAGMGMDAEMDCPKTVEVGGLDFRNAGDAEYGEQTVTEAFATSCNTALVTEVADRLDSATMTEAAEEFGFNSELSIGIPVFSPQYPSPDGLSLLAQASIGQGQMLTSPLHMATVPAAVAAGEWHSPRLVTDPAPEDLPEPRPVQHADELRTMMREVVTDGTAESAGFTGNAHGKTGTAEFGEAEGDDDELESHAWFVGFDPDKDVAFAVVVDGGGAGSTEAAPLGADFLNAL